MAYMDRMGLWGEGTAFPQFGAQMAPYTGDIKDIKGIDPSQASH